jgi:hypothetical protein
VNVTGSESRGKLLYLSLEIAFFGFACSLCRCNDVRTLLFVATGYGIWM